MEQLIDILLLFNSNIREFEIDIIQLRKKLLINNKQIK